MRSASHQKDIQTCSIPNTLLSLIWHRLIKPYLIWRRSILTKVRSNLALTRSMRASSIHQMGLEEANSNSPWCICMSSYPHQIRYSRIKSFKCRMISKQYCHKILRRGQVIRCWYHKNRSFSIRSVNREIRSNISTQWSLILSIIQLINRWDQKISQWVGQYKLTIRSFKLQSMIVSLWISRPRLFINLEY